jgi:hypothetical protein
MRDATTFYGIPVERHINAFSPPDSVIVQKQVKPTLKYIVFSGRALTGDELLAALSSYEKRAIERGES